MGEREIALSVVTGVTNTARIYRFRRWEIDLDRRLMQANGFEVPLGGRAFEIVGLLVQSAGELVTKTQITDAIWLGAVVGDNALQVHISAVRKALGPDRGLLQTASGRGYRLLGAWSSSVETQTAECLDHIEPAPVDRGFRGNLSFPATDLIGRSMALQDLQDLLSAFRIVTLIGAGGIGKSSLALRAAHRLLPSFQGHCWLVDLSPISDPRLLPSLVAGVLGLLRTTDSISPLTLAREIGSRKLLLIIDNCDHLIDAVAPLAETLVRNCPLLSVLVTARESLRIDGESIYRVAPLEVPSAEQQDPDDLHRYSAIQLFLSRAGLLNHLVPFSTRELVAVAEICRRLDGIPLAIELAATRAATVGIDGVLSGLNNRFALLTRGRQTSLPRHQTLRATLDWSYDLLSEAEQRQFACLAVFAGGFTLEAASVVARGYDETPSAAVGRVASLVEKSLVALDTSDGNTRWLLLETMHVYALEKLATSGMVDQVARRHAIYFHDLLTSNQSDSATPLDIDPTKSIAREIDNVRAALAWSFSSNGDINIAVALAAASAELFLAMSLLNECRSWTTRAIAALDHATRGTVCEMTLQGALGLSKMFTQGNSQKAVAALERGITLAEDLAHPLYQLRLLGELHIFLARMGAFRQSLIVAESSKDLALEMGEPWCIALADCLLGCSHHLIGDHRRAQTYLEAGLTPGRSPRWASIGYLGYNHWNRALCALSKLLWLRGLPDQAVAAARRAIRDAESLEHPVGLCIALIMTVSVFIWVGAWLEAEAIARRLMALAEQHSLTPYVAVGRGYMGEVLLRLGEPELGMRWLTDCLETPTTDEYQIHNTAFTSSLAEAIAMTGHCDEALITIRKAVLLVEDQQDSMMMPELLRLQGEILVSTSPSHLAQAEEYFWRALTWARRQDALSWELRAAISLARLRQRQGRLDEAQAILSPVHGRFREGFDSLDLRTAKSLLEQITQPVVEAEARIPRTKVTLPATPAPDR
jgi:predicted ATPase/DNA-binding winged helix-turn-helix (wHTH) protein